MKLADKLKSTIRDVNDYPHPGILFKDITPVLATPSLMTEVTEALVEQWRPLQLDAIAAVEARGFIFGAILAEALQCRFIPVRKAGKLPYHKRVESYSLEYGQAAIEMHTDAIQPGWRVLIHDDVLATGGTAAAAGRLVQGLDGVVAGFSFLINLSFLPGEQHLASQFQVKPQYLVSF